MHKPSTQTPTRVRVSNRNSSYPARSGFRCTTKTACYPAYGYGVTGGMGGAGLADARQGNQTAFCYSRLPGDTRKRHFVLRLVSTARTSYRNVGRHPESVSDSPYSLSESQAQFHCRNFVSLRVLEPILNCSPHLAVAFGSLSIRNNSNRPKRAWQISLKFVVGFWCKNGRSSVRCVCSLAHLEHGR